MSIQQDTTLEGVVVQLPADLARVREAYGRFKIATVDFAQACQAAHECGRTQRQIASAAGCTQPMVSYAMQAYRLALDNSVIKDDLEPDDFDAAMREVRKPKPKDIPAPSGGSNIPPDDEILDGVIVGEDEPPSTSLARGANPHPNAPGVDPLAVLKSWTDAGQYVKWWRDNGKPEGLTPCLADLLELIQDSL